MIVISILNKKGGVSKTTLALNLAAGLADMGNRTVAVDNDSQGNLTSVLLTQGLKPTSPTSQLYHGNLGKLQSVRKNMWLYAGDEYLEEAQYDDKGPKRFASAVQKIADSGMVDYMVIDNNPSIGNLTFAGIRAATHMIIPVTCERWSVDGMTQINKEIKKMAKQKIAKGKFLGFVATQYSKSQSQRKIYNELRSKYPDYLFSTTIGKRVAFHDSVCVNRSVFEYYEQAPRKIRARAYDAVLEARNFVKETLVRIGE